MPAAAVAVVAVGAMAYGAYSQKRAADKQANAMERQAVVQKEMADLERRKADIQNSRTLRAALRQSRIARGMAENMAAQSGTLGSSGFLGGVASLGTQEGVNTGVFVQQKDMSEEMFGYNSRMANENVKVGKAQAMAAEGKMVGQIGSTLFSLVGGGFA